MDCTGSLAASSRSNGEAAVIGGHVTQYLKDFPDAFVDGTCFVDKTPMIEAHLRHAGARHLILRPRGCGKTFFLQMLRDFLKKDPTPFSGTWFSNTKLADKKYERLVNERFHKYPVICLDMADFSANNFETMLDKFRITIRSLYREHIAPDDYGRLSQPCKWMYDLSAGDVPADETVLCYALGSLAEILTELHDQRVYVLIDGCDDPFMVAYANGFRAKAEEFFRSVLGYCLKDNSAVCGAALFGVSRLANSGWLSAVNNIDIFNMDASDDRYASGFLFTRPEVELLLASPHSSLRLEGLDEYYGGYVARSESGPVKQFNPSSVRKAIANASIRNYWVASQSNSLIHDHLKKGMTKPGDIKDLVSGKAITLHFWPGQATFEDLRRPAGVWKLLRHAGYICRDRGQFWIPNCEVCEMWITWFNETFGHEDPTLMANSQTGVEVALQCLKLTE